MTTLLLIRVTLLKMKMLILTLLLVLEMLRILIAIPLANWSLVTLMETLLTAEALAVITTRALSLHSHLSILTLAHII